MSDQDGGLPMVRRLTTIVAADIASFSRLVSEDEEGVLAALRARRAELVDPLLARHAGRIANAAGDSLLVEFPSAVEAVRWALALQRGMHACNTELPEDKHIVYRIGINIGEVVAEGDDHLGDGVNVAARLEGLCLPGGILLSRSVRDMVHDRLELRLADLGEVAVKNIVRPVRVFRFCETTKRQFQSAQAPNGSGEGSWPFLRQLQRLWPAGPVGSRSDRSISPQIPQRQHLPCRRGPLSQ